MDFQVMDEAVTLEGRGIALLIDLGDEADPTLEAALADGCLIQDARGAVHTVDRVTRQDGFICLLLLDGSEDYFGRLFRDVLVDATHFILLEGRR